MASTTCGWCHRIAHMEPASDIIRTADGVAPWLRQQAAFTCANCHAINIGTDARPQNNAREEHSLHRPADLYAWSERTQWLPKPGSTRTYPDVPEHIAAAATEATLCLSTGAHRAVASLARAVLEATAKDKGVEGDTLPAKTRALVSAGHLNAYTAEVADEIRHFGNAMAHGDFTEPVDATDATTIIELMNEILHQVYQGPARVAGVREKREAKKAATT